MTITTLPGGGISYPADENPLGIQAFAPSQAGLSPSGYDSGNTAGSGLPSTTGSTNAASSANDFWQGVESLGGLAKSLTPLPGGTLAQGLGEGIGGLLTNTTPGQAASGIWSGLVFITDVPRVTTTLIGLILIIVGLAALIRQPITINTVRTAAEAIA